MESFPSEVWLIILSHLLLNDLIEVSAVCKLCFCLFKRISFFNEKLLYSRLLFNNSCSVFECFENACLSFYGELHSCIEKYVKGKDHFIKAREVIMSKLMLSILLFRLWNHIFLCGRSQYCIDMCIFCTKSYVLDKKISGNINKTLLVPIEEFHPSVTEGIVLAKKIYIFIHTNIIYIFVMFLLIRMTCLEDLVVLALCTIRALTLHFFSGRCIWTLSVE